MDRLEDDLRRVLTDPHRTLPPNLVTLERVHAGATHRRRVRAAGAAVAAVAVLAGGIAVGATQLRGGDNGSLPAAQTPTAVASEHPTFLTPTPTSSAKATALAPPVAVPADLQPQSFTAIGTRTWFVLGTEPGCDTPPCAAHLVKTSDGGRTFTALAALPAAWTDAGQASTTATVSDVRFASPRDGWVFGGGLWSTHDGGASWHRVPMPGQVLDVEAGAGVAWAIVERAGGARMLMSTDVTIDGWNDATPTWATPSTLAVDGNHVVVWASASSPKVTNGGSTGLLSSTDAGRSWSLTATPSCHPDLGARPSASGGGVWLTCPTGTMATIYPKPLSDATAPLDTTSVGSGAAPNSVQVAPLDATTAALGLANDGIAVVTGSGKLLHTTPVGGALMWLGFTTRSVGYAIVARPAGGTALLRTTDAGATWRRVSIR